MPITVHTEHGPFTLEAAAEDVTQSASTLIINRDGKPVAKFRDWTSWHEHEPAENTPASN